MLTETTTPGPRVGVWSEAGRLRRVLVCAPGLAHQRLTPDNCDELLFDEALLPGIAEALHAKRPVTIVAIGGAGTAGTAAADPERDSYPHRLQEALRRRHPGMPITVINKGVARQTAQEMVDRGVRATLTCVDPRQLDASYAGRGFDRDLLADLPASVDPCGENGEFHTFVHDGPGFASAIAVHTGEVVERDGFVFADVLPGSSGSARVN